MDKFGSKAIIAAGAFFTGKIKQARLIEINGKVTADLEAEKVTIGAGGTYTGGIKADLVVIAGQYEGNLDANSIWATATASIAGEVRYKTLQMDRGAALNCRIIHNWIETPQTETDTGAPRDKSADMVPKSDDPKGDDQESDDQESSAKATSTKGKK